MVVHVALAAGAVLFTLGSIVYERDRPLMPLLAGAAVCLFFWAVL